MKKLRCILCNLICGVPEQRTVAHSTDVPFDIREASHSISNSAMLVQGSAKKIEMEASGLLALAEAMKNR